LTSDFIEERQEEQRSVGVFKAVINGVGSWSNGEETETLKFHNAGEKQTSGRGRRRFSCSVGRSVHGFWRGRMACVQGRSAVGVAWSEAGAGAHGAEWQRCGCRGGSTGATRLARASARVQGPRGRGQASLAVRLGCRALGARARSVGAQDGLLAAARGVQGLLVGEKGEREERRRKVGPGGSHTQEREGGEEASRGGDGWLGS
jgi:hypothetical protein